MELSPQPADRYLRQSGSTYRPIQYPVPSKWSTRSAAWRALGWNRRSPGAEDGTTDTVRPRLEAAGADLKRVHIIDTMTNPRPFSLLADLDSLDELLESIDEPQVVIIDPLNACLAPVSSSTRTTSLKFAAC
jgi:hypothetical protein